MEQEIAVATAAPGKKNWRKKLLLIAVMLVVVAVAAVLIINSVVLSAQQQIISVEQAASLDADCILVLGAGVQDNGEPSLMLRDRLLKGIELYQKGAAPKLLMSGDHGTKGYDEVNVMKDFALASGIPSQDIFMDHAGFATYDSLYRARDIFQAQTVIVVSQRYHLPRALYIAKRLGLTAYGVAAEDIAYAGQSYRDLREVAARCKDFWQCIFLPEPALLGEAIPVSGNGDQTND